MNGMAELRDARGFRHGNDQPLDHGEAARLVAAPTARRSGGCSGPVRRLDWPPPQSTRARESRSGLGSPAERSAFMDRRNVLGWLSAGAAAGCIDLFSRQASPVRAAQPKSESPPPGLPPLKITDIATILTAPNRIRL